MGRVMRRLSIWLVMVVVAVVLSVSVRLLGLWTFGLGEESAYWWSFGVLCVCSVVAAILMETRFR